MSLPYIERIQRAQPFQASYLAKTIVCTNECHGRRHAVTGRQTAGLLEGVIGPERVSVEQPDCLLAHRFQRVSRNSAAAGPGIRSRPASPVMTTKREMPGPIHPFCCRRQDHPLSSSSSVR